MLQQATNRGGRPAGSTFRCFMPGSHLNRLVPLLQQVLPPDTTGETLEHVCAQVVLWMYLSTSPTREASMLKELASMGAKLTRGEPGSLGTFKLEIDHG